MKKQVKAWLLGVTGAVLAVALVVAAGSAMQGGFVKATDSDIAQETQESTPAETQVTTEEIVVETTEETEATEETQETEVTEETQAAEATQPTPLEVQLELEPLEGEIDYGKQLRLKATVLNAPEGTLSYTWQFSLDGEEWKDVPGTESLDHYDFVLDETNGEYYWRVIVNG